MEAGQRRSDLTSQEVLDLDGPIKCWGNAKAEDAVRIIGFQGGDRLAAQSKGVVEQMRLFGEKAGIAFQIKDDLFDYTQSSIIGKPTGIDIREQKMTLPLIYTLNTVNAIAGGTDMTDKI